MSAFVLYRFFDSAGTLLYAGNTRNLAARLGQHESEKAWWGEVDMITVERFDDLESVRAAEQAAIDDGAPIHNQVRALGKTPITGFRIPEDVKAAAVERATREGKTLTDVVVEALRRYGRGGKR